MSCIILGDLTGHSTEASSDRQATHTALPADSPAAKRRLDGSNISTKPIYEQVAGIL